MAIIFNLTLPFFALVALGYFAARFELFEANAVSTLNKFVFNFAMPALVISALANQELSTIIEPTMLAGWLLAAIIIYLLTFIVGMVVFKASVSQIAILGQAGSVANVGFLAIPLIASAFGPEAVRIPAALLIVDLMIVIPFSIALIEASGGGTVVQAALRSLKGAVLNPFCIAILAGIALSATGIGLPGPTQRFASFLAGAAGPTALFALGLSLSSRRVEGDFGPIAYMAFVKLALHPLLAYYILSQIGIEGEALAIAVVVATMPIAGNVFVIAQQYGVMVRRASTAVLISTIIAVITVGFVLNQPFVSAYLL